MRVFARVVFKNKDGWRSGKYLYYVADDVSKIEEFAKKKSRGREFQVQTDYSMSQIYHVYKLVEWTKVRAVYDLDKGRLVTGFSDYIDSFS